MAGKAIKLLGIQAGTGGRMPGAQDGPWQLREAGLVERLARLGHSVDDLGDIPGIHATTERMHPDGGVNHLPSVLQVNRHTHACVLGTMRKSPTGFLLVVGGDHSLAIGTLAGLSDACERLGVLWIDAHADFNTPASSPTGNVHGMSLAIACGLGHRDLRSIADRDPMIEEDDVFLLGARDIDDAERDNLRESRVHLLEMADWRCQGLASVAREACHTLAQRCDRLHLSFDIDVLDPLHVPGTGTPVPGGLSAAEAHELLAALGRLNLLHSAEFVEYNPELDTDGRTGELTLSLIEAFLAT
jgi:arginase